MSLEVTFISRGHSDTPSIERVFAQLGSTLQKRGVDVRIEKLPFGNGLVSIIRNLFSFRPTSKGIFHITGHVHYIALVLPKDRTVLTVHDLGILHLRKGLRRFVLKKLLFDWPVRRLNSIVAISDATRDHLIAETDCPPEKINVIHNPIPDGYRRSVKDVQNFRPVLLQVGTAKHKNLERVIEAICGLDCELRIVGGLDQAQQELLIERKIKYVNHASLDDAGMLAEYERADIVVFCSLFEGFGMPIIEAQAIGRPVITSDLEPMRSIAGDAAFLVDPSQPDAIRTAIDKIIIDEKFREDLVQRGFENCSRFSAEHIADQYISIYQDLIKRPQSAT